MFISNILSETAAADRPVSPEIGSNQPVVTGQYVLHPPLPSMSSSTTMTTSQVATVPLLLNPAIIEGTTIPIISTQVSFLSVLSSIMPQQLFVA